MGYKNTDPCLQKAYEDERLFVLMTRDATAPQVVLEWIKLNLENQPVEKLREAFECAMEMKVNQSHFREKANKAKLEAYMDGKIDSLS